MPTLARCRFLRIAATLSAASTLSTAPHTPAEVPPAPALTAFAFEEAHMGTLVRITLYADGTESAEIAAKAAFDRISELNDKLSDYLPQSELMQLCESPAGKPVDVSTDLFRVLSAAKMASEQTGGAFDFTAGHLTNLWRRAKRKGHLPDEPTLADALARTGHRLITLDSAAQTVTLGKEGMLLDLGGIAKGYAADAALQSLSTHGISRALVAIGGDISVGDPPPGESGWPVALSSLDAPEPGKPTARVRLSNCGISTSGDTRQFVEIAGKRYSHIVDPRTGLGLTDRIGVTLIAPSATLSDSLATAASVLGWERGITFVAGQKGTAGRFVRPASLGGPPEIKTTPGFPETETASTAPDEGL